MACRQGKSKAGIMRIAGIEEYKVYKLSAFLVLNNPQ